MNKIRAHLIIQGRVQGVFFRANTREEASRLGLTGWVRNCPDGSVEVMVEGDKTKVEELIRWCHQGPPGAHVTKVETKTTSFQGEFKDFSIRY
jgi:acylphosphatase